MVAAAVRDGANLLVRGIEHGDTYELKATVFGHGLADLGEELAVILRVNDRVVDLAQCSIKISEARHANFGGLLGGEVLAPAAVSGELPEFDTGWPLISM